MGKEEGPKKCYTIDGVERPVDGDSFVVFIKEKRSSALGGPPKYALGTLEEFKEVTGKEDGLTCPEPGTTSLTFKSSPKPDGVLGKNCFVKDGKPSKECLFVKADKTVAINGNKVCIRVGDDMTYCQLVNHTPRRSSNKELANALTLKINSLQYDTKILELNVPQTPQGETILFKGKVAMTFTINER